jgi:NADH-quinone oxidoreductase subunit N
MQALAPLIMVAVTIALLLAIIACKRMFWLTASTAGFGIIAALLSIPYAAEGTTGAENLFAITPMALGFIALILVSAALILLIATAYWQADTPVPREEFLVLLLIATFGAITLAASANFITLFLGLETMTLAMIGLIAYPRFRPESEEAALKYLILSAMSSAFVLFGIGLIELATGSLDFGHILAWAPPDPASRTMVLTGLALLGIGAGFKLSVVPFHIWVPDIYGGAPAPSGAYVAVVAKLAVLAVLIRVIHQAGGHMPANISALVTGIAILSMLAGNLLALLQENFKRVLGYSSIAHLGYLLVAILAGAEIGQMAVAFYLVTYAITMIAAFGAIAARSSAPAARDNDTIASLRGLFWTEPALASVLTLSLLSLAGIPPAIGFIAKMYIFASGIHTALWALTGIMVVSSVIGLFYYLNIILVMSMRAGDAAPAPSGTALGRLAMAVVTVPILGFGIAPQPLMTLLQLIFR